MKIVITGSHGVGKTTLSKLLQEELNMRIGVTGAHGVGKTTVSKYTAGKNISTIFQKPLFRHFRRASP
jgi:broad-specificity NMP kinase